MLDFWSWHFWKASQNIPTTVRWDWDDDGRWDVGQDGNALKLECLQGGGKEEVEMEEEEEEEENHGIIEYLGYAHYELNIGYRALLVDVRNAFNEINWYLML